jgi:hypothetical protein
MQQDVNSGEAQQDVGQAAVQTLDAANDKPGDHTETITNAHTTGIPTLTTAAPRRLNRPDLSRLATARYQVR